MWLPLVCVDMRAKQSTHGIEGSTTTAAAKLGLAVVALGGLVALFVAASYPTVSAAVAAGVLSTAAVQKGAKRLAAAGRVCVPGLDVCYRPSA